jgi:hypothetical protein
VSPVDARILGLSAELRRDWQQVQRHAQRARDGNPSAGEAQAAYVALALDHAYEAFEQLLLRVERALGLPARTGEHWHRALLADAGSPIPRLRTAIVPAAAADDWSELLGFRHFLRHAYAVDLDSGRLAKNAARLEQAVTLTEPSIVAFLSALDAAVAG